MRAWVLVAAAMLAGCAGGTGAPPGDSGSPGDARPGLEVVPSPARVGEPVLLRVSVTGPQTLKFRTGQRYDFEVLDGERVVWRWSDGQFFTQVLGERRLPGGERLAYEQRWTPTSAGSYRVRGAITADPRLEAEAGLEVRG